jgi:hypothetical protein
MSTVFFDLCTAAAPDLADCLQVTMHDARYVAPARTELRDFSEANQGREKRWLILNSGGADDAVQPLLSR